MASIQMKKVIPVLLTAILNTVVPAAGNALLTAEQRHTALCVQTIAHRYFSHGRSTVVSMPPDLRYNSRRPLIQFPYSDDVQLVDLVLQHFHEDTCCPVQILPPKTQLDTTAEINHNYIIFIWREQEDEDITDILRTQLIHLQQNELLQWNPRGRFVVVITDQDSSSLMSDALKIYEIMWMEYKAVNTVVLMPDSSGNYTVLDLYTGFPYQNGNCEQVKEITLVDQWIIENNGRFSENKNLYPSKIPKNFQKCVIKVASIGFHPFVSLISAEKEEDGNTVYEVRGLMVEYFLLSIRKMNLTVVFLEPSLRITFEAAMTQFAQLAAGIADVVVGFVPLLPIVVTGKFEPSIPYFSSTLKWFVPCPKSISRADRFLTVFNVSVWLTMIIVFFLTSALFWFSANYPDRMVQMDSKNLQTIPKCMYNAWSIFIGVSVPQMPRSWKVRIFFLTYVCYCFAISTVFQAFFVSYLVEPGYGEKIATFQELLDSDVNYGFIGAAEFAMSTMEFSDHLQFPPTRRVDCVGLKTCLMRMMSVGDVATLSAPIYAKYLANEFGRQGEMNSPCSLEEDFIDGRIAVGFSRGNPLVNQFNTHLRRCLEGGLGERYWAQLNHEALIRSRTTSDEDGSSMYFVFTLSHMVPAFSVLGFGYLCSTIIFIAECLHKRFSKG
jgi:hypothetical protein